MLATIPSNSAYRSLVKANDRTEFVRGKKFQEEYTAVYEGNWMEYTAEMVDTAGRGINWWKLRGRYRP